MNLEELSNLDFENIGSWPLPKRIGIISIAVVVLFGAGYWFYIQPAFDELSASQGNAITLHDKFVKNQAAAANLGEYEKQSIDLGDSIKIMLDQLPRQAEVAALLTEISQTGNATGLEFELFQPDKTPVTSRGFQNQSIKIKVMGTYHEFGQFVSGVAALPRIVTLHNVSIGTGATKGKLFMEVVAKIYFHQEEGTSTAAGKPPGKATVEGAAK